MKEAASGEDGWAPEFGGQRPPFAPGNEEALVTGHRSERHVGPLAAQIAGDLLTDPDVPPAYPGADVRRLCAGVGAR